MRKISKIIPEPVKSFLRPLYYRFFPMSGAKVRNYWKKPEDKENLPESYMTPVARSEFLVELFNENIKQDRANKKILEIGCNVGRNLNFLLNAGYKNLAGVEINEGATTLMKKVYPETAEQTKIYNNSIEDEIKNFEDNAFDAVFTMAVLEHIHPESEWIFSEIARITKNYLFTIEDEKSTKCYGRFPRNYKEIFKSLNMKQIKEINCKKIADFGPNFWARVFIKKT